MPTRREGRVVAVAVAVVAGVFGLEYVEVKLGGGSGGRRVG